MGDKINIAEEKKIEFEHGNKKLEVMLSPREIVVSEIGKYDGYVTTILGREEHLCGAHGYNPMLGDRCARCDELDENRRIMDVLKDQLRKDGILTKYKL